MKKNSWLDRAIQARRMRVIDAFHQLTGEAAANKILELTDPASLPDHIQSRLPYRDNQFDWVACYELIDLVDTHERQVRLLRELLRIASKGVFISTVNRRHPLDLVSGVPFTHWITPPSARAMLAADDIQALMAALPGKPDWQLGHVRLGGIKSHYFLMIRKA